MTQTLVRSQSPEEKEFARYLEEIELRRQLVAAARADLESLKESLERFEAEYFHRVGGLFVQLDRVKLSIQEYERRIWLIQSDASRSSDSIEREVESVFRDRQTEVKDEEETARKQHSNYEQAQSRFHLEPNEQDELKRRYRDLARRFHPDLARSKEEGLRKSRVMQRVNAAFHDQDIEALRKMEHESAIEDLSFNDWPIGDKLIWAIREIARLDELLARGRQEVAHVRASSLYRLWERSSTGEDVISVLANEVELTLTSATKRLTNLIITYQSLLEQSTND